VGNRGQGTGKARACTWAKISSRPQGPAPALMEHGPPTPIFPHTHTFCPAQTQHLNQRPEYTQRTPSTPTYPLPKFTVKNPTLTYLSMLLFPVPPITKQAGNLTWRLATCKIPSKASHKSTNVQEVACKFHTSDIDHYSTILENSYNDFVLSRWLQSSVVYSSTFFNLNTISMTLSKSTRTQLLRVDTERVS